MVDIGVNAESRAVMRYFVEKLGTILNMRKYKVSGITYGLDRLVECLNDPLTQAALVFWTNVDISGICTTSTKPVLLVYSEIWPIDIGGTRLITPLSGLELNKSALEDFFQSHQLH